jgi:hypothetical protein
MIQTFLARERESFFNKRRSEIALETRPIDWFWFTAAILHFTPICSDIGQTIVIADWATCKTVAASNPRLPSYNCAGGRLVVIN